ncbi:MAG TPA: hypothetical protein DCE41_36815, partial [Cytophagales bacterium]|nr:hypothetical protein [Cytophagales bacterium]
RVATRGMGRYHGRNDTRCWQRIVRLWVFVATRQHKQKYTYCGPKKESATHEVGLFECVGNAGKPSLAGKRIGKKGLGTLPALMVVG